MWAKLPGESYRTLDLGICISQYDKVREAMHFQGLKESSPKTGCWYCVVQNRFQHHRQRSTRGSPPASADVFPTVFTCVSIPAGAARRPGRLTEAGGIAAGEVYVGAQLHCAAASAGGRSCATAILLTGNEEV